MILADRPAHGWDDYLADTGADGAAEISAFKASLYRQGFKHLYPPPFYSAGFANELAIAATSLLDVLFSVPQRVFDGDLDAWMAFQGVNAADAALLSRAAHSPRFQMMAKQFARPDLLLTPDGPKVVEVNVSTPMGGMNTHDPYIEQFRSTGYYRYLRKLGTQPIAPDMTAIWSDALLALIRDHDPARRPLLFEALANSDDVDGGRKFFSDLVGRSGFSFACGLVHDLDITPHGVFFDGRRVDVVFTMYTWLETRRYVPNHVTTSLIEADEAGVVEFVSPPLSALYDHKANLEILTSDAYRHHFTGAERVLLDAYLPKTWRLTAGTSELAHRDREGLVLKPATEYGGKGIVFGDQVCDEDWSSTLADAIGRDANYVLQERLGDLWSYHRGRLLSPG